jgi:Tfp pilus assembly protein PilF
MAGEMAHENDPGEELRNCRSAVALAPGYAPGWTKLAAADRLAAARESSLAERRRWLGLALEAIDHSVSLVPADPTHHANRGRVLGARTVAGSGEADAALAEFDTAIAMSPHNLLFRADAGQTAIDCGRPERAREYFEEGRAVDPTFARFTAGLGAVELAQGHPAEAIQWLKEANSLHWYYDNVGYERLPAQLAAAHLAARHAADAEQWARRAIKFHPEEAVPHWMLAGALEMEGSNVEAAGEYRTVLKIAPGWRPAREALRRLGGGPR